MSEKHVLECNYPNGPKYGPGCICPPSGSSACSGADAREADKALMDAAMEHPGVKDVWEYQRLTANAAVSPRSSDGLLPCPFCGVVPEPVWIGTDRCVLCQEEDCPTNARGTLEHVIAAWNTRV